MMRHQHATGADQDWHVKETEKTENNSETNQSIVLDQEFRKDTKNART